MRNQTDASLTPLLLTSSFFASRPLDSDPTQLESKSNMVTVNYSSSISDPNLNRGGDVAKSQEVNGALDELCGCFLPEQQPPAPEGFLCEGPKCDLSSTESSKAFKDDFSSAESLKAHTGQEFCCGLLLLMLCFAHWCYWHWF